MSDFIRQGHITSKGHALLAKVLSKTTDLNIVGTRCGDGIFNDDPWELEALIAEKLSGNIVEITPHPQRRCTEIVLRFTNETVTSFFKLREIGIYALDPDEGEILYAYANYGERANFIEEYSGTWYTEDEITFYIYTANATNIIGEITRTTQAYEVGYNNEQSQLNATNVQEAIDELASRYVINRIITHQLNTYPDVLAIEFNNGYGMQGYGEGPYGGSNGRKITVGIEYLDNNNIQISTKKSYPEIESISKISNYEYVIIFADTTTTSLYLALITASEDISNDINPTVIYTNGIHFGDSPPEDTNLQWLRQVN